MIPRHTSCRGKTDHILLRIRSSSEKGGEGVKNTFHISIPDNNETLYPGVIIYEIKTCLKNRKMYFRRSLVFHVFPNNSKEMLNTVTVINTSLRYTLH